MRIRKKSLLMGLAGVCVVIAIVFGIFLKNHDWGNGYRLNPYQVSEIVVTQTQPNPYVAEQGYRIQNGKWIRKAIDSVKNLEPIRQIDPPKKGADYTFFVQGKFHYFIVHGSQGWLIYDQGRYFKAPKDFLDLISAPKSQFLHMEKVESWTNWNRFVKIDGHFYFIKYTDKPFDAAINPLFTAHKEKMESSSLNPSSVSNHYGTLAEGTPVYKIKGKYYVRDVKEPDQLDLLVAEESN